MLAAMGLTPGIVRAEGGVPIEEILVVGARLPRPVQDVLGKVDVIDRQALIDGIAVNADDVLRYTPGVSVARADGRFGATEFTVRGLSGNRVTVLIDRVPVADQFNIGAFAHAGQDYLIPDAVARIEILRGPASTLFGSDALGGVVAVETREPEDYLDGQASAASLTAAASGADGSTLLGAAVAGGSGPLSAMLHGVRQDASERDAAGSSREDDLDRRRRAAFFKVGYQLPEGDRLRLKVELFDETVASRPEGALGFGRQFANTTFLRGDDQRERRAVQLDYDREVGGRWADYVRATVYGQRTDTDFRTFERRDRLPVPVSIERQFDYEFRDAGLLVDLDSGFELGRVHHRLGWGVSAHRARVREQRDGLQRNLTTGATTNVLLGETLPARDFPNSTITEAAVYLHDEISVGAVTWIPGVRYEVYDLDARADALYREGYPDTQIEDVREHALVPKLGVQWRISDRWRSFAQYARGFRAPPFKDVNIGLSLAVPFAVEAIPNPDLEAETSDGVEVGIDHRGERLQASLNLFGADYDDFIESKASLGFDPTRGALLFQSRNIERARVYGAELSVSARLTDALGLDADASWTRGENRDNGKPLNTVDPPALAARLRWQPSPRWHGTLALRAAAAQTRVDEGAGDLFQPDGYAVFDLSGGFTPSPRLRIHAGLFNITDRQYWSWGAVRGRVADDPLVDLLAAPGRYGALSMRLDL
ncbi:MAG: TonB-dependent receptor [Pseudomonadales bacterium]